jgi:hypothetical protein
LNSLKTLTRATSKQPQNKTFPFGQGTSDKTKAKQNKTKPTCGAGPGNQQTRTTNKQTNKGSEGQSGALNPVPTETAEGSPANKPRVPQL